MVDDGESRVNDSRSLGVRRDQGDERGCRLWLYVRECLLLALTAGSLPAAIFPELEVERTRDGRHENGAYDPERNPLGLPGGP